MEKFKVGNTVKIHEITHGYTGKFKVGDTGVIDRFQHDDAFFLVLVGDSDNNDNGTCWHEACNIHLAEDTIKPVTQEYQGNIYELDKHYLFGISHQLHKLLKIDKLSDYPFRVMDKGDENGFKTMHLVNLDAGTITPAPIELINGAAYSFSVRKSETVIAGIYDGRVFNVSQGQWVDFESCTNIRPMTVTESK
jgi:hypothetical protein